MLAQRSIDYVRSEAGVGISAGVAVYPVNATSLDAAVRAADDALGRAKRSGKGRVVAAQRLAA